MNSDRPNEAPEETALGWHPELAGTCQLETGFIVAVVNTIKPAVASGRGRAPKLSIPYIPYHWTLTTGFL